MEYSGAEIPFWMYLIMPGLWLVFGFWCGRLAERKGYSFWIGFVAGFFGGLIGVIVFCIIKPASRPAVQHQPYREGQYTYQPPGCGRPPERAQQPPADAYAGPPPEGRVQPPQEIRSKVCRTCSNLIPGDARFCAYCGSDASGGRPW